MCLPCMVVGHPLPHLVTGHWCAPKCITSAISKVIPKKPQIGYDVDTVCDMEDNDFVVQAAVLGIRQVESEDQE